MRIAVRVVYLLVFLTSAKFSYCQEPLITDKIEDKVVIGCPGITVAQLNQIKLEFLKYDQIIDSKFIIGNHNCLLIIFDQNKNDFTVYAELLKIISTIYNVELCYFKVKDAYNEITGNIGTDTIFEVK
jgi:hypothetical protein